MSVRGLRDGGPRLGVPQIIPNLPHPAARPWEILHLSELGSPSVKRAKRVPRRWHEAMEGKWLCELESTPRCRISTGPSAELLGLGKKGGSLPAPPTSAPHHGPGTQLSPPHLARLILLHQPEYDGQQVRLLIPLSARSGPRPGTERMMLQQRS